MICIVGGAIALPSLFVTMYNLPTLLLSCALLCLSDASLSANYNETHIYNPRKSAAYELGNKVSFESKLRRVNVWFPQLAWPHIEPLNSLKQISANVSEQCRSTFHKTIISLTENGRSAIHVLDASAKFRPGFVSKGQQSDFGYFEQCPQASHQHYFIDVHWPLPNYDDRIDSIPLKSNGTWLTKLSQIHQIYYQESQVLMACLPSLCTTSEYNIIARDFLTTYKLPLRLDFNCDEADEDLIAQLIWLRYTCMAVLLLIAVVVIIATLIRHFQLSWSSRPIIRCLDVVGNVSKVMSTSNRPEGSEKLDFLNSFRMLYSQASMHIHLFYSATSAVKYTNGIYELTYFDDYNSC